MDLRQLLPTGQPFGALTTSRRRLVIAALSAIAVVSGLNALRPAPLPTRRIWVAARDLSGGQPLVKSDVRTERLADTAMPDGVLMASSPIVGRLLAAPMRRGEPLTDVRLLSPALLAAQGSPDDVAVPIRLADGPAAQALVHAGDLVDVIETPDAADIGDTVGIGASADQTQTGESVIADVRVLATPASAGPANDESGDGAGLLIVAATPKQAEQLAKAAGTARLSVAVRRSS